MGKIESKPSAIPSKEEESYLKRLNSAIKNLKFSEVIQDTNQSLTFKVDNVKPCTQIPPGLFTAEQAIRRVLDTKAKFEDFSHRTNTQTTFVFDGMPGFITALHTAFQHHYPLRLSVSDFIILIAQGLSKHINSYPEELRKYFVDHEGKAKIIIERDEFVMGAQNDWSTVFGDFAQQIKSRVKTDIYDVVIDDTSVATQTTRIVSEITLMDCMKKYFSYSLRTLCGIPNITLEGTKEDWEKLKQKVNKLVDMNKDDCLNLKWWLDHVVPIVNEICNTGITRQANLKFWRNIYKYKGSYGSGGVPTVTGWCTVFFPYLEGDKQNRKINRKSITTDKLPQQISDVPFEWNYHVDKIPMTFSGGYMGAEFNSVDYSVKPACFWSVAYDEKKKVEK